jgi:hypothetical protein
VLNNFTFSGLPAVLLDDSLTVRQSGRPASAESVRVSPHSPDTHRARVAASSAWLAAIFFSTGKPPLRVVLPRFHSASRSDPLRRKERPRFPV